MNELLDLNWLDRFLIQIQHRYCELKQINDWGEKEALYLIWAFNLYGNNDPASEAFGEQELINLHKWLELNPTGGMYEYVEEGKRTLYSQPASWEITSWMARAIYAQTLHHFTPHVRDITRTWDYMENVEKLKLK